MNTLLAPLYSPILFFNSIAILCIASLAMAFTAEYVFGLEPCILCIYQRWPFVFALGLTALGRGGRTNGPFMSSVCGLLGLTFLFNASLAFYHSGIERKWWDSHLEGCAVDFSSLNTADTGSVLDAIMAAPAVRCDEIPWADPVFGLSMANYNVAFCAGLAVLCFIAAFTLRRP